MKKRQKVLKTVHFLVNYVTFVIDSYSYHLWNFSKLTPWVCLLHTKTFLFYIVFLTMKRDVTFFFEKWLFYGPPFVEIRFLPNFLAHLHTNFEFYQTSRFQEKRLFCWRPFSKKLIESIISTMEGASVQRTVPIDSAYPLLLKSVIFMVPSFFFLEKWSIYIWKSCKKLFWNCPLSRKLRDFCYWLLLLTLVKFVEVDSLSMFFTHQNVPLVHSFPYCDEGRGIFLWKNYYFMDLRFSKFIFPKSFRASAHQFLARSDHPFSRKRTLCKKLTILKKVKWVNHLDIGGCQRSTDGTNRFGILFTTERCRFYGSVFFLSRKMINF